MTKRFILIVAMLFLPALAKADSFVDVTLEPRTFTGLCLSVTVCGSETIGATFLWDTTTNVFSDINVTASGILGTDWTDAQVTAPGRTRIFFGNAAGDNVVWSASTDLYPPVSQDQVFSSTPGVYRLGLLELDCASCFATKNWSFATTDCHGHGGIYARTFQPYFPAHRFSHYGIGDLRYAPFPDDI